MHYCDRLGPGVRRDAVQAVHDERRRWVNQAKKGFLRYRTPYEYLRTLRAEHVDCSGDAIVIGHRDELDDAGRSEVSNQLRAFMPWRKGPFSIFGIDVDAEWRSERKWNRLAPHLPDLGNRTVADIGCNNGYYMFKMAPAAPRFVLGFEPTVQHYYCFRSLNAMAGCADLAIDLLGVEHIALFPECFDVIFLMGVIYHRPSPIDVLRDLLTALRPGGTLIVESQALPGDDPVALFPEKTYAKAPGTYFVPTGPALRNWLVRAGYAEVELFCSHPMSSAEQRRTAWMRFESYRDFIDPGDPGRTVEGYPAPWRVFLSAVKPG